MLCLVQKTHYANLHPIFRDPYVTHTHKLQMYRYESALVRCAVQKTYSESLPSDFLAPTITHKKPKEII